MDEKQRVLWISVRRALLMIVTAIEVFVGIPAEQSGVASRYKETLN